MKEKVYEKKMNKGKEERNKTAMKIALINENSQAAKNELICSVLEKVVVPMGHTVDNYGMYRADDEAQLTYVQAGILGAILLNSGAADYIIKPCSPKVLEARMALRLLPNSKADISLGGLTLNVSDRTAAYKNNPLELTSSEFNVLMFLMQNAGKFYTANEIYEQVWKMPHLNTETIKKHLSNLRKKMFTVSDDCASLLATKFGKGYAFVGDKNE